MKPADIFSAFQLEQFIQRGYVILRGGFSPEVAALGRDYIWNEMGLSADQPQEWMEQIIHLQQVFYEAPFDRVFNPR